MVTKTGRRGVLTPESVETGLFWVEMLTLDYQYQLHRAASKNQFLSVEGLPKGRCPPVPLRRAMLVVLVALV